MPPSSGLTRISRTVSGDADELGIAAHGPDHHPVDQVASLLSPLEPEAGPHRRLRHHPDPPAARLIRGSTRGPVFVTHRKPGPGKVVSPRDVCPGTGLVPQSCRQDRAPLDAYTTVGGVPGTGRDLREYRHAALTRLGEARTSLPMLMAKSRHKKSDNTRHYFHPSADAVAEVTSLLAPGDSRR
ncbi:hypothetical protein [Streptomyces sp. DH10]|uniref:hypothetical protein n=1 Tax=Streptomyces sp. DH10 TaxID=3040121 RepID=UPI003FA76CAA